MSLVSGCLYAPYNSDTNAYRIPRVLHWLGQGQWHWIHTEEIRMNVVDCGYEWLMTPLMLFTHTDRFLFLLNWVSYLMLPGLFFCVLRYCGAAGRVAWWWSWLLASGWCYVMQAASVANDLFGCVYALAAVALALKARETRNTNDLWISLLAAALATGAKQTNIPLALLWVVAVWPQRRMVLSRPMASVVVALLGLLVSFLPLAVFNYEWTRDWSGVSAVAAENPTGQIQSNSPFWSIVGNAFCVPLQNIEPPFLPKSGVWSRLMGQFLGTSFGAHFRFFESFGELSPGISESSAGIGLVIALMTGLSIWGAMKYRREVFRRGSLLQHFLWWTPWLLLLVFMAKDVEKQSARHMSAYYVFLFPLLLATSGQESLVRKIWWQRTALLGMAVAIGLCVVNINRPLFPVKTIMARLAASHPQSRSVAMLKAVYDEPATFESLKGWLQEQLPPGEPLIGYTVMGSAPQTEPFLWQPWGSRRVEWVLPEDPPGQLLESGIHFVVVEGYPDIHSSRLESWMARYHAHLIANIAFKRGGHMDIASNVYIMRLDTN